MVRRFRPMLGRKPRRDHPNHHDVLFTDVRDDKCLLLRRRVSGDSWLPADVAVFSLVLGVAGLLTVSGTHVRYFLVVFLGSIGFWFWGRLLRPVSTRQHGLGRRGSWV